MAQCLDSVRSQTYGNFLALLINDGSSDNSAQIAMQYAQSDKRFILLQNPHNQSKGVAMARNAGLDYIFSTLKPQESDYIGFVDSDDVVAVDYFANLISCLESKNHRIMVAKSFNVCRFSDCDRSDFTYRSDSIWWHKLAGRIKGVMEGITRKGGKVEVWRAVYRAEFLRNLRFNNARLAEDVTFGNVVNALADKVAYTRKARYFYRQRAGSLMQKYAYCYDEQCSNFAYMLGKFAEFDLLKSHRIDTSLVENMPLGAENECLKTLQHLIASYRFQKEVWDKNPHLLAIVDSKNYAEFRAKIQALMPFSKRLKRYFQIDIRLSQKRRKIYIKLFGKVLCDR